MSNIEDWLDSLSVAMPLSLIDPASASSDALVDSLRKAMKSSKVPLGGNIEALLYLRIGQMEPSHSNVQDAQRSIGAYIHGVLHRMEGDYWNAKYWFDRVRDPRLLDRIRDLIREFSHAQGSVLEDWGGPLRLTDACKNRGSVSQDELAQLAFLEWQALWRIVNESAQ